MKKEIIKLYEEHISDKLVESRSTLYKGGGSMVMMTKMINK